MGRGRIVCAFESRNRVWGDLMNGWSAVRVFAALLLALLLGGAVGCGPAAAPPSPAATVPAARATTLPAAAGGPGGGPEAIAPPAPLAVPIKVHTGHVGSLVDGPIFIALERGYFAEAGLDVEDIRAE